jgi:MFS family permease
MSQDTSDSEEFETKIPARMDRLPWSKFHWLVIFALGATWTLDGLEIGLVSALGAVLTQPDTLGLTTAQVGYAASIYLGGEVIGALVFGYLTDKYGRSRIFFITMAIYFLGVAATGLAIGFWTFALFRFIAGLGIGGEYAAIYSAIDELIPADYRGWADLAISGSYWIGAGVASILSYTLLTAQFLGSGTTWRYAFGIGAVLAIFILFLRRYVPESPRWLMIHHEPEDAEEVVSSIEESVKEDTGEELEEPDDSESITMEAVGSIPLRRILTTIFRNNTRRAILCAVLFITQAFLYNAIYFTYTLILTTYYNVPAGQTTLYGIAFAAANFAGAIILGRFFDTVGRRPMITGSYGVAGILLAGTGYLFLTGTLTAITQTALWCATFFFATAAASAAYLTVSEIFPMEVRAQAIAVFFAIGQAAGGVVGPSLFGILIGSGARINVFYGYIFAAALMVFAAIVEWFWGVEAAQKSLEEVSTPLSAFEQDSSADSGAGSDASASGGSD